MLDSYLVEITADVLQQTDPVTGEPFVDIVLDAAGQKGNGKWTSINALDMGVPAPKIAEEITEAYRHEPELANLLLAPHFKEAIDRAQPHWRKVVALAAQQGVPAPTFAASLAYYDSYRSARLPQNLLQAQRDYFGAHTYERVDQPRGRFFHIDWPDPERPQREA